MQIKAKSFHIFITVKLVLNLEGVRHAQMVLKISYVSMLSLIGVGAPSSASCPLWLLLRALEKMVMASNLVVERYNFSVVFLVKVAGVVEARTGSGLNQPNRVWIGQVGEKFIRTQLKPIIQFDYQI